MPDLTLIRAELETALAHLAAADGAALAFATFARLDLARKAIQSADRALGREIEEADEPIQTALMNAGFASVRLDDPPATLSVGGLLWAGVDAAEGEDTDAAYARACAALRAAGWGQFPAERFNVQQLSAHVRELRRDDPDFELPAELVGAIKLTETMRVKVTKRAR